MERLGLLNRDFLIDTVANFFIYIVFYLLLVITAPYAMDTLHATPSGAGLASSIFIVGSLVARIFTGRFIERIGRKRTVFFGLVFFLLTTFLYFGVTSLAFLFVVRMLHGIGFGISATSAQTFIANIVPQERRGEGIGYFIAFSSTIASAVGPFLGMYLNRQGDFRQIIVICVAVIAVSCFVMLFLKIPEVDLSREQREEMKRFSLGNFFEAKAIPISAISVFVGICYASIVSFIDPFARQADLTSAGSLFFVVYAAFLLLSRPIAGRLFDRKGENSVMYPCFVLFAAGLAVIGSAERSAVLLLAAAFVGCGFGTFLSSAQTIAVKVSLPHRTGVATSTFYSFLEGGMGFGPFFLGLLVPMIGYRGLYRCMAAVVLVCICPYFLLHGRTHKKGFVIGAEPRVP